MATVTTDSVSADTHATGRHRREGRCPSGNNSSRKVPIRPMPGTHAELVSTASTSDPGTDPGAVTAPYRTTSSEGSSQTNPIAIRIQPIGLRGRRTAMTTPTAVKANDVR